MSWASYETGWRAAARVLAGGLREELGLALEAAGKVLIATGHRIAYRGRIERALVEAWTEAERLRRRAMQRKDLS